LGGVEESAGVDVSFVFDLFFAGAGGDVYFKVFGGGFWYGAASEE